MKTNDDWLVKYYNKSFVPIMTEIVRNCSKKHVEGTAKSTLKKENGFKGYDLMKLPKGWKKEELALYI